MSDAAETIEKEEIFSGPLRSVLVKLSLPIAGGMVFQMVYNITDAIWISLIDKNDPSYFGGSGIIFPLIFVAIAIGNGLMVGTGSLVARAIGERNQGILDKTAESALVLSFLFSIILMVPIYMYDNELVAVLGATGDYALHALEYLRFILPCTFFLLLGNSLFGILQGEALVKYMVTGMIIGTMANIILDPVFIFILGMEVKGAALATVIAQVFSVAYTIFVFASGKTSAPIHWKVKNADRRIMKEIMVTGFPQALSQLIMAASFFIFNRFVIAIDELALTAFSLYGRFEQLLYIPVFAMNSALITVIGQNAGRGNIKRCRKAYKQGILLSSAAVIVLAALFILFSKLIFSSLSDIEKVVDYAVRETQVLAFGILFAVIGVLSRAAYQAVGQAMPALFITLFRLLLISIPAIALYVNVFGWGIYGVWFGIVTGGLLTSIVTYPLTINTFKCLEDGRMVVRKT